MGRTDNTPGLPDLHHRLGQEGGRGLWWAAHGDKLPSGAQSEVRRESAFACMSTQRDQGPSPQVRSRAVSVSRWGQGLPTGRMSCA